jgi:nucleoside-diphosphate-sugar epimerase
MDINVYGTRNVVNACLANDVKRLVHVSSVAALGRLKDQRVINEGNKWAEGSAHSVYAESKYLAELEVFRGQEEGLSTVMINPSVILAPADWNKSSARLFRYVWKQGPFYTDGVMNYVDVRDVVESAYQLLHRTEQAERFILNAGNISFKDFFDKVADRFNTKGPSIRLNKTLLGMLANVESIRTYFSNSEPLITRETSRWAGTSFFYDNQKVTKKLSFQFQPIDKTLQWCCEYYIEKERNKKSV